ncbi:MAG: ABC transporter permease subunit, partial [Dehalococcoidia bacterium]|nr:ABC transporter permease subunit [Dehalococcoidia bacterium]
GLNIMPVIALIILGVFFPVLMTVYEGVKDTDPSLIEAAKSYGASEKDILLKVVLLATIPYIVAGMRLGISRALIGTVVAQMYIATGGLGYIIQDAGNVMDTPSVFVAVAMLALSGWSLNMMMRSLERRISPWVFARQVE